MDKAQGIMSQAEYARHRGTSRQYIGKLGKEGVLLMRNGKVDVAATDAVLDDHPVSVEPGHTVHDAPSRGVLDHSGPQPTSLAQARVRDGEIAAVRGGCSGAFGRHGPTAEIR